MDLKVLRESNIDTEFWYKFDALVEESIEYPVQQNSIWLANYIKYYLKKDQKPFIISVYEDDRLVGCLPMQLKSERSTRFYNINVLNILGFGPTDFFDFPVIKGYESEILSKIITYLKHDLSWDKLELTEIPESSKNLRILKELFRQEGFNIEIDYHNGFYSINTNIEPWSTFEEDYFNPQNKDLLKAERRAKNDDLDLKTFRVKKDVYNSLMECVDLYSQRRETLGQFNNYTTEALNEFLKNVIDAYEKRKMVELTILKHNEFVLAFQLDWVVKGIRNHWNHAYNEDFKRYSPGKIILKYLLEESFNDTKIISINHMRGLSAYKQKFTNEKERLVRIKFENPKSYKLKLTKLISKMFYLVRKLNG